MPGIRKTLGAGIYVESLQIKLGQDVSHICILFSENMDSEDRLLALFSSLTLSV